MITNNWIYLPRTDIWLNMATIAIVKDMDSDGIRREGHNVRRWVITKNYDNRVDNRHFYDEDADAIMHFIQELDNT